MTETRFFLRFRPGAAIARWAFVTAGLAGMAGMAGLAGCAAPTADRGPAPTERDLLATPSGTPRDQIIARFGQPFWTFAVRQEGLSILNYRFGHNECVIYQVSVRPDGTVRDVAPAFDPACSGPN